MAGSEQSLPISVIIPTYNRCHLLRLTLPHCLAQDEVEEIVIVDDASADDTESYISELRHSYPMLKYVRHSKRRGPPPARNTGLDCLSADSTHVLFGEDDVIFSNDFCAKALQNMQAFGSDIVGGRVLCIRRGETFADCLARHDRYIRRLREMGYLLHLINEDAMTANWFFPDRVERPLFLPSCSLLKRHVVRTLRFDENYRGNYLREETDLWLRARMKGFKMLYAPDCVAFHSYAKMGGCHDYGFLRGESAVELTTKVDVRSDLHSILNNSYFLNKFYDYLKKECHYIHSKQYYKSAFALHLVRKRLTEVNNVVRREAFGLDDLYVH
jgi:glycosyltransferase involved in cell wall biosynthesis